MDKRVIRPQPEEVLPEINRVLARAGCPPDSGEDFLGVAISAAKSLLTLAEPVAFSAELEVISISDDSVELEGFTIFSADMARKLSGSETVSLFLATIGLAPEDECRVLADENRFIESLFLDAASSEMVEKLLRHLHHEAAGRMRGMRSTARYAPGYGDFSLDHQARIVELLGGGGTGVRVMDSSFMLVPKKSTTGVVGWKKQEN